MNWKNFWNKKSLEKNAQQQVGRVKNGKVLPNKILNVIAEDIKQKINLKASDTLLDVCCGNGILSVELARHCKQLTAIDFSDLLITQAKKNQAKNNIHFMQGDALNLDINTQFDKIVLYFSFQYFDTYDKGFLVIKNLKKHLKPNGNILLGDIPNATKKHIYYNTLQKKIRLIKQTFLKQNDMGKFWSETEMNKICEQLNLQGELITQKQELPFYNYRFDYLIKHKL